MTAAATIADVLAGVRQAQRDSRQPYSDLWRMLGGYLQRCHQAAIGLEIETDEGRRSKLTAEYDVYRRLYETKARQWFPRDPDPPAHLPYDLDPLLHPEGNTP